MFLQYLSMSYHASLGEIRCLVLGAVHPARCLTRSGVAFFSGDSGFRCFQLSDADRVEV